MIVDRDAVPNNLILRPLSTDVSHTPATIDVSAYRPAKRRRVVGLNARFDRMIKSANTLFTHRTTSPALSRKRVESSGTSSTGSHDFPKTPVDAYRNHHPGKLGKDFSLLKMKSNSLLPREFSEGFHKPAEPSREPRDPLPDWLANTFCSLEAGHPLRGLLSPSLVNRNPECYSRKLPAFSHEEEIFAFSPFDKQEEVPDAGFWAKTTLNISKNVASVTTEPGLSNRQLSGPTNPVPFSTPGHYASVRMPGESSVDRVFEKPVVSVPQQVTSWQGIDMVHPTALPPSPLRLADMIERPQLAPAFPDLIPEDIDPSLNIQELRTYISPRVSRGADDRFNVYATPGPTFACSRPVYFDSPTEDPSLSDPLNPESYELSPNAIEFRWRPFLQSSAQEKITARQSISPSPLFRHAIPNQVGDQSGWQTRLTVDQGRYGASNEELPLLAEDLEVAYLDNASAIQPSNANMMGTISNSAGPWPSPINDVLDPAFTFAPGIPLSPLQEQSKSPSPAAGGLKHHGDGENTHASEKLRLLPGGRPKELESEAEEGCPSTPIRQLPVPLPRAPQKVRPSRLRGASVTPIRKMASALSWMIPLKSSTRVTMFRDDVNYYLSHVTTNLDSHDSIESWG